MSSILVLERESRHLERIHDALTAEGYRVKAVLDHAEALAAAASEAPSLLLLDAGAPGAESLARSFSRSAGGPGVIALVAGDAAVGPPPLGADDQVGKPFSDGELRQAVLRVASLGRAAAPPQAAPPLDQRLTSQDIFGDMLEEVESELAAGAPPSAGAAAGPAAAPPQPEPRQVPRPGTPTPRASEDVERKLERTLSGVLGSLDAKPRPAPPPKKPADPTDAELDALIGRTLSSLELGPRRPAAPKPAAPAPPPAAAASPPAAPTAAPQPAPSAPSASGPAASAARDRSAPPQERTGVQKPERTGSFQVDRMAELEALARPRRGVEATKTGTGAAPAARPSPAAPAAGPPPAAPAAPAASDRPASAASDRPAPLPVPPPAAPRRVTDDALATQRVPVYRPADDKRFGQYALLERIAVGGMAEVWKARMTGVEGFQKTVAIKRILSHMTDNAEFVGMFIDEAKLAAQLSHPNIIHIYDLGKIGQDYYIAMEFVEGKDLRSLLNAAARWQRPLPVGLALLVGSRLASALDYAHRKRDFEGREMGLVHRDVSPQNVLITYDGEIKLCDFGIAKAVSKASQTQMGALKGKLQYMSPEQAWGRAVDSRSDIFSLGCLLFEMLAGERLFAGTSEMSVLESVREGRIRSPRAVAPAVPERVEAIVLKALAVSPDDRYQTAGELQAEIDEVLYSLKPAPGHADLAAYMHQIQAAERDGVAPPEPAAAVPVPAPVAPAVPAAPAPSLPPLQTAEAAPAAATPATPPTPAATAERLPEAPVPVPMPETPAPAAAEPEPVVEALAPVREVRIEEGTRRGVGLLAAAIGGLIVLGVLVWFLFVRPRSGVPADQPPAAEAPAPPVPAPAAPAAGAAAAPAPAGQQAAAPDVTALVDQAVAQQVAAREQELRRKLEAEQRKLERELAQAKAASPPVPAAVTAPAGVPQPQEAPPAAVPGPEPQREEPAARADAAPAPAAEPPAPAPSAEPPAPAGQEEPPPAPAAPRVREGDLVQPGAGVKPPSLVSLPKPQYPPVAKKLQVEGVPVVAVLVDENGRVEEAKLEVPIKQNVGINEAALSAARAARYNPATKDGVRVKMWTRLRIPFKL